MLEDGEEEAVFAIESAFSLPEIPTCDGTHMNTLSFLTLDTSS